MDEGQGTQVQDVSGSGLEGDISRQGESSPTWSSAGAPMNCTVNNCSYTSGDGDFSILINSGNDFIRTLKNGNQIYFNSEGLQIQQIDRNGNTTLYAYDNQQKIPRSKVRLKLWGRS